MPMPAPTGTARSCTCCSRRACVARSWCGSISARWSQTPQKRYARHPGPGLFMSPGSGKTMRTLWLSADARAALADYLQGERATDAAAFGEAGQATEALFLRAWSVAQPKPPADQEPGGRMAVPAVHYH